MKPDKAITFVFFCLIVSFLSACGGGDEGGGAPAVNPTVGPAGGTVTSSDGNTAVKIPSGALSQETAITVELVSSPGSGSIGTVYEFGPSGTTFSQPVTISIRYDEADLPPGVSESSLRLGTFINNQWATVGGSSVDTVNNIVSGTTTSFSIYGIVPILPDSPTGVSAVGADGQVTISWEAVSGATSYHVYWNETGNVTVFDALLSSNQTLLVHSGLTNGTTYYYVVTAVNGVGESAPSSEVSATPEAALTKPDAPQNVQAAAGDSQVSVSWSPVSGATSYNIYWNTNGNVTTADNAIPNVTPPYPHMGRTNGQTYYYIVTAVNSVGEGDPSGEVTATPEQTVSLSVAKSGSAGGTVTSAPLGINCGVDCSEIFVIGTVVTLTATPDAGAFFVGWSGACSGTGTCNLAMNSSQAVTAQFDTIPSGDVTLNASIDPASTGSGVITSNPGGINCGADCVQNFAQGTLVTLTATPEPGSVFSGWSGACSGTGNCVVTMNANTAVSAEFDTTSSTSAFTVSGTVAYSGSHTGRVYLRLVPVNGFPGPASGTSIPGLGHFTIRGVRPDDYRLEAYMDHRTPENGTQNASNPIGSVNVGMVSTNVTGVNLVLQDPPAPSAVFPPSDGFGGVPFDRGAVLFWESVYNSNDIEIPEFYNLYWSTNPNVSPTVFDGKKTIASTGDNVVVLTNLTNGEEVWFIVTSMAGGLESPPTSAISLTVGQQPTGSGPHTLSGTITYPGPATGPLFISLYQYSNEANHLVRIDNPTSPQPYSFPGLENGVYELSALIDNDNSGTFSLGDIKTDELNINMFTINGGNLAVNQVLTGAGSFIDTTNASFDGLVFCCVRFFNVRYGTKLPVAVALSGPNIPLMDLYHSGRLDDGFDIDFPTGAFPAPVAGDTYRFDILYSDGTTDILYSSVEAVLDSFASPLSPSGAVSGNTQPTFTWSPPASPPPSPYFYYISVSSALGFGDIWNSVYLPSYQTSIVYNADGSASLPSLIPGQTYRWQVRILDQHENQAFSLNVSFTP